jgi:hypothetical protein
MITLAQKYRGIFYIYNGSFYILINTIIITAKFILVISLKIKGGQLPDHPLHITRNKPNRFKATVFPNRLTQKYAKIV